MSWDNVSSVKNINLWTGYSDTTQGHLFVNGKHQLQLKAGVTFNLKSGTTEGPTQDEVAQALSLINNQDGGPLKYLTLTTENIYTRIYDPNHMQVEHVTSPEDDIYDYIFEWYVNSTPENNHGFWSEGVALKLAYTDSTGKSVVVNTSTYGSGTKAYVTVCCYQPVLYGKYGENRIALNMKYLSVTSDNYKNLNSGNYTHESDAYRQYWLYIDDGYFTVFNFDGAQDPKENVSVNDDLRPYSTYKEEDSVMWDWIYCTYFPNVKCGAITYDVPIKVMSSFNNSIYDVNITVNQLENQITFLAATTDVEHLDTAKNEKTPFDIHLYDQFGNSASVHINSSGNQVTIESVS